MEQCENCTQVPRPGTRRPGAEVTLRLPWSSCRSSTGNVARAPRALASPLTASAPGPLRTHPGKAPPTSSFRRRPPGLPTSSETLHFSLGKMCVVVRLCYLNMGTGPRPWLTCSANEAASVRTGVPEHRDCANRLGPCRPGPPQVGWHLSLLHELGFLFLVGAHPSLTPCEGRQVTPCGQAVPEKVRKARENEESHRESKGTKTLHVFTAGQVFPLQHLPQL